jgi:fatty-acyl-CoA synthase
VRKPGSAVTPHEITQHLTQHVAKWWLPDEILFVDDLPHTATGKLLKTVLREQYKEYRLTSAA